MATGDDKPLSLDADIDMADLAALDAPTSSNAAGGGGGAPSTRFRPKAKGKPKTKLEPKVEEPKPKPKLEDPKLEAAAPMENSMEVDELGPRTRASASAEGVGASASASAEEVEDGDDFVVREIDVYFTPKPFDDEDSMVRVKPLSSKVEVDLDINTECENYDPEFPVPLRRTEQTLSSSKAADVADYAVGVLRGNLVHLNHIDVVVQLRPSMLHVNSGRSNSREALHGGANSDASGSTMPSVKRNERLEDSKDCTEESEPWISLTYQPAGSNIASKYHAEMVSNEGGPIDFTMNTSDYLMSLCPGGSTGSKGVNRSHAIREMLKLPLEERLKKWFTEVSQVNQFDALMHLAQTYSEDDLLKVLPVYADLVHGLWVCKSSLLFDDGYACKRDRILLEFTKKDSIPLKDVDRLIRVDDERRKILLPPLCKRREKLQDYKFILPVDSSFIKRYPHIVKEQDHAWSVREITMRDSQETSSHTEARKTKNSAKSNIPSKGPDPNTSKAKDGPVQGVENLVQSVLETIFTANKVRSIQAIRRDLRQLAAKYASDRKDGQKLQALSNAATSCAALPLVELQKSVEQVAVHVHGVYVAKTPTKKSLRHLILKLFHDKDPNAKLTKQEILDSAVILKRDIEKEYHQVISEICIQTEDGHLVLKNGDEP
ncbi:DNA-directed RNA polymerase III subunit RPC5 isoform X2 [Oryza brachyantha]|uniref:DNA-directed RNA polymerase III subunit RPC5 isoform X2 n=1 Tax=Oryza brachyantha TaxID=4533 RepID=UPI0007761665|nr:DNA-directed RNA polymerase III subunit RPC5 isoform X2 [Oryza brachyantha]